MIKMYSVLKPLFVLILCLAPLFTACGAPTPEKRFQSAGAESIYSPAFVSSDEEIAVALTELEQRKQADTQEAEAGLALAAAATQKLVVIGHGGQTTAFKQRDAKSEAVFTLRLPNTKFDTVKGRVTQDGKIVQDLFTIQAKSNQNFNVRLGHGKGYVVSAFFYEKGRYLGRALSPALVVGDIFLVAGQSNSASAGSGKTVSKSGGSFMFTGTNWQQARDPYYTADGIEGSSAWPNFGDFYFKGTGVPAGVIALGWGQTYVSQWQPGNGSGLYARLEAYAKVFGRKGFRAVLWHQGESDVFAGTYDYTYRSYMQNMIGSLRNAVGWQEMPWFVARASHIGVSGYYDLCNALGGWQYCAHYIAARQAHVINGQNTTTYQTSNVFLGPYTDQLTGATYRAWQDNSYIHFNPTGQYHHARLWYEAIKGRIPPVK